MLGDAQHPPKNFEHPQAEVEHPLKNFEHPQKFKLAKNPTESKKSCPLQRNNTYCSCASESHNTFGQSVGAIRSPLIFVLIKIEGKNPGFTFCHF